MKLLFVLIFWVGIEAMSDILETITIDEGKVITSSLANLTALVVSNHRFSEAFIKDIKIYPISDSDLYPFRIQSGEMLFLSSPVDRESTCSEGTSKLASQVCSKDTCCQLLGFQYKFSTDVQTFFILVKITDINDQEPKFKSIKHPYIKIPENVEERFIINLPLAEDKDSPIYSVQRYTISQQFPLGQMTDFKFLFADDNPLKPQLIVVSSLDYEKEKIYKFKLSAFDSPMGKIGYSCSTTIEIEIEDINDNSPKFELASYNVEIKENEILDNILKWKVFDADSGKNGMVSVTIDNEEMSKKFQTTKYKMNEGYLSLILPLDYENDFHSFEFSLVAKDNGIPSRSSSASVKIKLKNVNDIAPKIKFKTLGRSTSNTVSIKEGVKLNSLVIQVWVSDADSLKSAIKCRLLDFVDLFYLDEPAQQNQLLNYKIFHLKTISNIDRESDLGPFIRITVQCSDGDPYKPLSSNESLNIQIDDINDNAPEFSKSTFLGTVEENQVNANVQFSTPVIASDKDFGINGKLDYFIEDIDNSTDSNKFLCDKTSGKIVTQKSLDFEVQSVYKFKLIAKDQGIVSLNRSVTIVVNVIDLNDNAPIFTETHYTFTILEDARVGTVIGSVSATDKDTTQMNKLIRYNIESKSGSMDYIEVDKYSGEVRTKKSLDRELHESFTFKIIASNSNPLASPHIRDIESEAQVLIKVLDVNDNPPTFILKANMKSRIEFFIEQYQGENSCLEIPYTVQDADDQGTTGPHCCIVSLENDYDNLVALMTNMPSYICVMRRPLKYQSLTITLIATDRPMDSQKSLSSKVSFPLIIKTDPNLKMNNNRLPETTTVSESSPGDNRFYIITAALITVVLVFLTIIIIIIIIIRRCYIGDQEYDGTKFIQTRDHTKDVPTNINCLMTEQSGKMTVPRGYMHSPQYSDNFQKTICRTNLHSQSTASSPFTPPVYHQIMTNQGVRIVANPRPTPDQYVYEWSPGCDEQQRLMTVPRSVLNTSSEKMRPLSPTRSESLHCQSKITLDSQHDSGYQILNPFSSISSPQRQNNNYSPEGVVTYDNNGNRSMTLINNFFDEENNEETNKMTPMTMKRNYFQTTFV